MAKIVKDGWHTVYGLDVYVENGKVVRGIKTMRGDRLTAYPYSPCKYGGWNLDQSMSLDNFRHKVKSGSAILS